MPGEGLERLKRDDQVLAVRGNIASLAILSSGKLIYSVVKVLKPVPDRFRNPQIEESDNENLIKRLVLSILKISKRQQAKINHLFLNSLP